jgi:hypothetical protein
VHSAHVPVISCSILLLLLDLLLLFVYFVHCSTFAHSLFDFCLISFFCSLFIVRKEIFNSDPGLYSRYFDLAVPVVQELSSLSMQVNKHHTSDCTDFVLV